MVENMPTTLHEISNPHINQGSVSHETKSIAWQELREPQVVISVELSHFGMQPLNASYENHIACLELQALAFLLRVKYSALTIWAVNLFTSKKIQALS